MRLLLVEDYPPLRKSVAKGLREAGFAVDVADNGDDGLWFAMHNDFDVIVLDLMLPGMDVMSVLRKLRQDGCETHVLILTAKDTVADRVAGLGAGADDYLVKPFAFDELQARVKTLVRRGYGRKDPVLAFGRLRIDTASQRVFKNDVELHLTPREYALLEYLAMRAGEMVSRTDIWEHVYEFHATGTSNVVDVYIGYLRKKIDSAGQPSLIRTIRGRGYTLRDEAC